MGSNPLDIPRERMVLDSALYRLVRITFTPGRAEIIKAEPAHPSPLCKKRIPRQKQTSVAMKALYELQSPIPGNGERNMDAWTLVLILICE